MNSLLKIKSLKFITKFNQNSVSSTMLTAVPLLVFSSLSYSPQTFANRPAMDERSEITDSPSEVVSHTAEEVVPETPSSVEIMMQQQTQQSRQTGDVMQLPAKEMQPGETLKIKLLDQPRRGMSMEKVQQQYGQPIATSESVGQPPITHWTYSDRVVYFEYSTVLHVVAR